MTTQFQKAFERFESEKCFDCEADHCGDCYREIKEKVEGMKDVRDELKFMENRGK